MAAHVTLKRLIAINAITPLVFALVLVATTHRGDQFLVLLTAAVTLLGLAIVNLGLPLLLWRRHGPASLLAPLSVALSLILAWSVWESGRELMLRDTPVRPNTFLRGPRLEAMEQAARRLLADPRAEAPHQRLQELGFLRVYVDTARGVVQMRHLRYRTWFDYLYAPDGLPGAYGRAPELDFTDLRNSDGVRAVVRAVYPDTARARRLEALSPTLAARTFRRVLGDSLLAEVRLRGNHGSLSPPERRSLRLELESLVKIGSGLLADSAITYRDESPHLAVEGRAIADTQEVAVLLQTLLNKRLVRRGADRRHLALADTTLQGSSRAVIEHLQLRLMQYAFEGLISVTEYTYDRKLREHWYYHVE